MSSTNRCAVLGSPITHSLSPAMHRAGYAALGLSDWTFEAVDCTGAQLPSVLADGDFAGLAVTMPAKAAAAAIAADCSPRVRLLGAANTLLPTPAGWFAENTDVDGVTAALAVAGCPKPERTLILGGGGTALAALAAVAQAGCATVTLAGRTPESTAKAAVLARVLGLRARCVRLSAMTGHFDVVISTLPVGAFDTVPVAELVAGCAAGAILDVLYHPWPTPLAAGLAGAGVATPVTSGIEVLLGQGFRQFELFTGFAAPTAAMRAAVAAPPGDNP